MQLIELFFKFLGAIITTAFTVVGGVLKFALGTVVVIFLLFILLIFGLLHAAAAI
jgi:hypothetical protein